VVTAGACAACTAARGHHVEDGFAACPGRARPAESAASSGAIRSSSGRLLIRLRLEELDLVLRVGSSNTSGRERRIALDSPMISCPSSCDASRRCPRSARVQASQALEDVQPFVGTCPRRSCSCRSSACDACTPRRSRHRRGRVARGGTGDHRGCRERSGVHGRRVRRARRGAPGRVLKSKSNQEAPTAERMAPDDAADLLGELDQDRRKPVFDMMASSQQYKLRQAPAVPPEPPPGG